MSGWISGHRALHEHAFTLEWVGEALVFREPGRRGGAGAGSEGKVTLDLAGLAAGWRGAPVTSEVNAPGWDGRPVDYELCLAALAWPEQRQPG